MPKKTIAYSIGVVCIVALIGFFISSKSDLLASDEVFNKIDFDSDYSNIEIFSSFFDTSVMDCFINIFDW